MNYWDQVAGEFDSLYDTQRRTFYAINRVLRRGLYQRTEMTCEVICRLPSPSVLDVGCGSGRNIISFLQAGALEVTGIDGSAEMLGIARRNNSSFGDHVRLIDGEFLSSSLAGPYDVVVALGVFDYLHEEAQAFLSKMRHLARRAVVFSAPGRSLVRMPLRAWRYHWRGVSVHFYRHQELEEMCHQAGFDSYSISRAHSSGYVVVGWLD